MYPSVRKLILSDFLSKQKLNNGRFVATTTSCCVSNEIPPSTGLTSENWAGLHSVRELTLSFDWKAEDPQVHQFLFVCLLWMKFTNLQREISSQKSHYRSDSKATKKVAIWVHQFEEKRLDKCHKWWLLQALPFAEERFTTSVTSDSYWKHSNLQRKDSTHVTPVCREKTTCVAPVCREKTPQVLQVTSCNGYCKHSKFLKVIRRSLNP